MDRDGNLTIVTVEDASRFRTRDFNLRRSIDEKPRRLLRRNSSQIVGRYNRDRVITETYVFVNQFILALGLKRGFTQRLAAIGVEYFHFLDETVGVRSFEANWHGRTRTGK